MVFWHVGGAVFLFRLLFRDPGVDLRFLASGALLPDAVDLLVGVVQGPEPGVTGRFYGHSLLLAAALLAVGLLTTERGGVGRKRAVVLAVGVMFHLLLDAMWLLPEVLLWPLAGSLSLAGTPGDWTGFPGSVTGNPAGLVQEAAGFVYLIWLLGRAGLSDGAKRSRLWRTGVIGC
ncbi:MAG: metal-dependent hydrolase [bacterium]|nr:metal-dependent hydrolase [bacterium]MDE0288769.1 metal-dependent hydrolase [bacterium]